MTAAAVTGVHAADQPVYLHLFTRSTDHVNLDLTEQRIERYLALVERFRTEFPQSRISLSFQFSGTVSDLLMQRNRANHLRDAVLEAQRKQLVEAAYDGYEEPTPLTRPRPNFRFAKTPEQRWRARSEAAGWFLTEYKRFVSGEPDLERSGGLKRMQEVFGEAAYIASVTTELGGDPETVDRLRPMNRRAILSGLPETQTLPARNVEGFRGGIAAFGKLMSPEPETSPEVYWQEGRLRLSDTSGEPVKILRADAGPRELQKAIAALDRSRIHVIRVELGDPRLYLRPEFEKNNPSPLQYAYGNPKLPRLPPEAFRDPAEIEAAFGREVASMEWLAGQFLPANPGSRWISSADLAWMAQTSNGSDVPSDKLRRATQQMLTRWKFIGNHPPEYARADGEYFSLADMFQMLVSALATRQKTGMLPDAVRLNLLHGPLEMVDDQGPSVGTLNVADIARAAAALAPVLTQQDGTPVPDNVIPAWITVDEVRLNPAQFLRLLAEMFLSPGAEERLPVKTSQTLHAPALLFPSTRGIADSGSTWTLKPARLRSPEVAVNASR